MGETKLSDSNTTLKSAARDRLKYRHHIALFHHAALQDVYLRFKYAASGQLEENFWMQHVHTYKEQNYSHMSLHMFQRFSVCSHKIQLLPELPSQFKLTGMKQISNHVSSNARISSKSNFLYLINSYFEHEQSARYF